MNDCKGKCHHLNHLEHDDGRCCAHSTKRVAPILPSWLWEKVDSRAEKLRMSRSEWVKSALEMFGHKVEVAIEDDEKMVRHEVTLPVYLCEWIEKRDSRYVARRIAATFANETGQ